MTNEKLLPCLFCGGEPVVWGACGRAPEQWIACTVCKAATDTRSGEDRAITAWNTRFSTPPGDDEVERVKAAIADAADKWKSGMEDEDFLRDIARAAITAIPSRGEGWQDIASAPRDGTYILARRAKLDDDDRWAHLASRCFVIRHEGKTTSGHDLGWAVYPGFGGVTDDWFECWMPLPKAPSEEGAA